MADKHDSTEEDGGLSPSDQLWFDRLTGKTSADNDAEAIWEADLLRHALLREVRHEVEADDSHTRERDEQLRQQILFAARREGLLKESDTPTPRWWTRGRSGPIERGNAAVWPWKSLGGIAAALALGIAFIMPLWVGHEDKVYPDPDADLVRDGQHEQEIQAKNPRARAEALAATLTRAGVTNRIFQAKDVFVVDVEVPEEDFATKRPALEQAGILPRPGSTRVRIVKTD